VTPSQTFGSTFHAPVLVHEVVELLSNAHNILDCTLGGGGHALALLERGARVTGLDQDPAAISEASARLSEFRDRVRVVQTNFGDVDTHPELARETFDGVLLDLGVSTHQLDEQARGFTFRREAPLDMRMDTSAPRSAADVLNASSEDELTRIFREYGDATRGVRLARAIVRRRKNQPFQSSDDLVGAIREVLGPRSGPGDFAPIFQAIRIAVNDEIRALERALPALREHLEPGGVMAVIAYHSVEDRLVKHAFRSWSAACVCPPRQPVCTCRGRPLGETITRRAVTASDEEVARNPRARSAHLRAWRRAA
jgi:16S rRNA (cytosine1402-N4)-methyltransferase